MDKSRAVLPYVAVLTVLATWGLYRYTSGLFAEVPPIQFLVILLFLLYFQMRSIQFADNTSYSLGVAVILPVLFNYGIQYAMWLSILASAVDGMVKKKKWNRTLFNCAQLTLAAIGAGKLFIHFHGEVGPLQISTSFGAMIFASLAYVGINYLLVTYLMSLHSNKPYFVVVKEIPSNSWITFFILSYMGMVCAFFIAAWPDQGFLVFSLLLMGIGELWQFGIRMNAEQDLRLQMEKELVLDPKTQVYNYRYIREWLNTDIVDETSILFIDLDNFKEFNDQYGHESGDQALRNVAKSIVTTVRNEDKVIRFGGEEFVVILNGLSRALALQVATRIQSAVATNPEASMKYPVTVSIGVASYGEDAQDKQELLRIADFAMYQAKKRGKNCIFYFHLDQAL